MGLGLPAAVRRETLNRWNALLDAPPSDASHTYVDVPAMLRKTVPQQALLPVKWGASKMAAAYLGGDSTRYCFFAFDTPANHHSLRARVAVKRSPMATQAQLAAYAAGKLPKQVLVGGRLFLRGAEPYPPGESDSWTTSTPLCLARAMATPRDKLRYYTLFYEALCDRACEAQGPLLVELDGPAQDADVVVIRCAPLDPLDGRSAVTRHHRPRDVRYGEADLKVQHAVCHPSSGIPCNTGLVFSVDTDMVAQMLLSAETLRTLGIRVVLVFPAHTKGGEREIVDCGRFPPGGAETLCFAMLLYGCDYSSSALGFGFDPTRVLFSSSFYAAFSITPDRLTVYLCSAGRRHISRPAAVAASTSAFQRMAGASAAGAGPRTVDRTTTDLFAAVTDILTVMWYWRFAGSSLPRAGPPALLHGRTPADLFGDQPLSAVLEGTVLPAMEPNVVLGEAGAPAADTDSSGEAPEAPEADRDGTPSPAKRRCQSLDSSTAAQ